ncbi:MAG: hypothetical protein WC824_10300 [Bacteroidota bacterium]|jgi:adenosylcobalamin-dependent ribonucleoside-triphosphate reductase
MIFDPMASDRKMRAFSLTPTFLEQFRGKQPNWGYNGLGYFVFKRTYSRDLPDGISEEFWQTCQRVVEGCFNIQKIHCRRMGLPWRDDKAKISAQDMFQRMWDFKFTPAGRGLWMMGTDLVYERGSAALLNCSFTTTETISTDFSAPFCFLMDMSMLGVGVGGDTRGAGKIKIQMPRLSEEPFVVEDSREGWVLLLKTLLDSFVGIGYWPSCIDFTRIRPRGSPIKIFGGVASGAAPLAKMVGAILQLLLPKEAKADFEVEAASNERVLYGRTSLTESGAPYKIVSSQIVDLFNHIGCCVVAGGVRRSSEILLGDPEDKEFLRLKQDKEALDDHRWCSNNSIFARRGMDYTEVSELLSSNGEPGIFWMENARQYGRMMDPPNNKDQRIMGVNPCGEICLEDREECNLVETYPAHHDSIEDFEKTLKMAYLYAKTVTLVPTHDMRVNAVMMRNRRIGCSMSGIIQAITKLGRRTFFDWCDRGYAYIQKMDHIYSDCLGIPLSVKTTTTKPSGTVSLLCGATPGIHYPHSEYYIRHVRVANTSPLVKVAKDAGYEIFLDPYADDTSVVAFPVHEKYFIKGKAEATIWEQFLNAVDVQAYWADNSVSATVTFKKEEARDIKTCLETFETRLKGVSLLPLEDEDHQYQYAPYVTITKDQYDQMFAKLSSMNFSSQTHDLSAEERFCTNDSCTFSPVLSKS